MGPTALELGLGFLLGLSILKWGIKAQENKGKARDQFIGKKIEERRAKAKAKGGGKPKEADEKEESDSSSVTAPPPRSEDLPPPGTVIAESTEGADQVAPERVENWADATEASTPGCSNTGQTEASQGGLTRKLKPCPVPVSWKDRVEESHHLLSRKVRHG